MNSIQIESSSEANYHWLLRCVGDIALPYAYPKLEFDMGAGIHCSVLARDDKFRANRITLSLSGEPTKNTDKAPFIEVHLYHDFAIAVTLATMDSDGYRCAFDQQGSVIPARLSEFNVVLERWLRRSAPASRRLRSSPAVRRITVGPRTGSPVS